MIVFTRIHFFVYFQYSQKNTQKNIQLTNSYLNEGKK